MNNYAINSLPHHNNVHTLVPNSTIVIQTIWNDESIIISLYLANDKKGYRGVLLKSTLLTTANALELNVDEFMAESKKALCTQNGLPNFTYILDQSKFKFCKATDSGFRIAFAEVLLDDRSDSVEDMLMTSMRINQMKDEKIQQLNADIRRMDDTFVEMQMALEKCVEEKSSLESQLLTKFTALLNTKKEKIVELERAIKNRSIVVDHFESDGSVDSDPDYCSQVYAREKSSVPSTSIQSTSNDAVVVPKRSKNNPTTSETIVNVERVEERVQLSDTATRPASEAKSKISEESIYDVETEMLLDDM